MFYADNYRITFGRYSSHIHFRLMTFIVPFLLFFGTFLNFCNAQLQNENQQQALQQTKSIAFYYNKVEKINDLVNFDRVVLTPGLVTDRQLINIKKTEVKVFAYLSIGEFGGHEMPSELSGDVLAINTDWQSKIMDLTSETWRKHLLDQATNALSRGFDGVFLDTLDSYQMLQKSDSDKAKQQQSLIELINDIQLLTIQNRSNPKLILNRGFEIIDKLKSKPYAVVAESMYYSFQPESGSYSKVAESDSIWLKNTLNKIKEQNIEVIVIDYVPSNEKELQIKAAKKLLSHGYTPYVSDGLLYTIGVSTVVPINRRVLGFYNSQRQSRRTSQCHRILSMPIEYLGYIPECYDINTFDFQNVNLNEFIAVTFWLESDDYDAVPSLISLIGNAFETVPMLFLNGFPNDPATQDLLGITNKGSIKRPIKQTKGSKWTDDFKQAQFVGFEPADAWSLANQKHTSEIEFEDIEGKKTSYLFTASWGGAALTPFPVRLLSNEKDVWLVDPFKLIAKTLKLPVIPVPDVTTESGRRILLSYVDGDGFPSKSSFIGNKYTAEILKDEIFDKYKIPHTVSVIQGEIYEGGNHSAESEQLENIARSIYRLPNVELASHTYSHPFYWRNDNKDDSLYGLHLEIDGYQLDFNKEILGSINYINSVLAPKNKQAKLILWTGRANPEKDVLEIAENNNIDNINGANTYVVKGNQDLTQVYPAIVWYDSAVQVYAPIINENLYTNLWTEHFGGFSRVIETFEILETPRRLKPISIYYHMYSGQYPASLNALKDIYDWALSQPVNPMYLSEFINRAKNLYDVGIAKTLDNKWKISTNSIKSFRLPNELGFPDTTQIVGFKQEQDGKYITLLRNQTVFTLLNAEPKHTYIESSNGQIISWNVSSNDIRWTVLSHVPMELKIQIGKEFVAKSCNVESSSTIKYVKKEATSLHIKTMGSGEISGVVKCEPNDTALMRQSL